MSVALESLGTAPDAYSGVAHRPLPWKKSRLAGWGRSSWADMAVCRAERIGDVGQALAGAPAGGIIAHGAGRSYGDAALNHNGQGILTRRLNRILDFDEVSGEVICEPGVTFADLLAVFLPRGYAAPANPGTSHVTVGGALAADVHGKDHDLVGSFGDHVTSFDLVRPDGHSLRVTRESDSRLFAATVGGMGLTGVVLSVGFRLVRAPSSSVRVKELRAKDLDGFLHLLSEHRGKAVYSVGWVDGAARGSRLGRGILQLADPASMDGSTVPQKPMSLPRMAGPLLLNRYAVSVFNSAYYSRISTGGRERLLPLGRFLYPLDAIKDWNRLHGRRGFLQFQCVLPDQSAERGLQAMFEALTTARAMPYLGVIKTLGGAGPGYLSFPMRGFTLALDFPRRSGTVELVRRLNRLARDFGGRVYLAKDATMTPQDLLGMYPKLDTFRRVLDEIDPNHRMCSDMARRLGLR